MDEGQGRGTGERGCPDNQADRSLNQYTARPDGQPAFDRAINLTNQRTNLVLVPEHHYLAVRYTARGVQRLDLVRSPVLADERRGARGGGVIRGDRGGRRGRGDWAGGRSGRRWRRATVGDERLREHAAGGRRRGRAAVEASVALRNPRVLDAARALSWDSSDTTRGNGVPHTCCVPESAPMSTHVPVAAGAAAVGWRMNVAGSAPTTFPAFVQRCPELMEAGARMTGAVTCP